MNGYLKMGAWLCGYVCVFWYMHMYVAKDGGGYKNVSYTKY